MTFQKVHPFFDKDSGGGGGTSDDDKAKAEAAAALQAAVNKAVDEAKTALEAKNKEILGEKDALKEQLKKWDGMDNDKIRELVSRLENDEDAKLVADGKVEELIDRRTERMQRDFENQTKALGDRNDEISKENTVLLNELSVLKVDGALRQTAEKQGVLAEHLEDAVLAGRQTWRLDKGLPTAFNPDDSPVIGKDGKNQITIQEWMEEKVKTKPGWTGKPKGGSATGGKNIGGLAVEEFQKLSARERLARVRASSSG